MSHLQKLMPFLVVGLVVSVIVAVIWLAISLNPNRNRLTPKFYAGQMVKMKAFGNVGMVIGGGCTSRVCYYSVRFPSLQLHTNTRLLSADGPIEFAPVSVVTNIREYELEASQ